MTADFDHTQGHLTCPSCVEERSPGSDRQLRKNGQPPAGPPRVYPELDARIAVSAGANGQVHEHVRHGQECDAEVQAGPPGIEPEPADRINIGAGGNSATSDPFDNLESLRLSQDFAAQAAVSPVFTDISCRKPNKQEFIRVRPGSEWRFETACFKDRLNQETYLVSQELWSALQGELTPTVLRLCIAKHSPVPFLWDIPLPGPDGRWNKWHKTASEAAQLAETQWVKVVPDTGFYVPHPAKGDFPDPDWPNDLTLADYLRLAFQDRFIRSWDHPVLRRLRGEL